jgi:hypothetical protein
VPFIFCPGLERQLSALLSLVALREWPGTTSPDCCESCVARQDVMLPPGFRFSEVATCVARRVLTAAAKLERTRRLGQELIAQGGTTAAV